MLTRPRATFDALATERSVRWSVVAAFLGTFEVWGNIAIRRIQKIPAWVAVLTITTTFVLVFFLDSFILR